MIWIAESHDDIMHHPIIENTMAYDGMMKHGGKSSNVIEAMELNLGKVIGPFERISQQTMFDKRRICMYIHIYTIYRYIHIYIYMYIHWLVGQGHPSEKYESIGMMTATQYLGKK